LNYPDKEVYAVGQDHEELKKFGLMDQLNDEQFYDALIIVTDCGNVERIDDQRYQLGKKIIKIDHHPNATPYGDLSWVDPSFTSASEMVAQLINVAHQKINQDIARTIFYGIVTDSLRFGISTTSSRTFNLAAYLLTTGFNLDELYQSLYKKDLKTLHLQSELIQKMQLEKRVGSIYLTKELMMKYDLPFRQNGMFANLLKDVEGIDIWVSFSANENNQWRVEFRSKEIPVNLVASKWGGGGHKLASGAIINNLEEAKNVIQDLQNLIS